MAESENNITNNVPVSASLNLLTISCLVRQLIGYFLAFSSCYMFGDYGLLTLTACNSTTVPLRPKAIVEH